MWSFHYFLIFSLSLRRKDLRQTVESLQSALNVSKVKQSSPLVLPRFSILSPSLRPWNSYPTTLGRRTTLNARNLTLFLNSTAPLQTPTRLLKWYFNSLGIRRKEMWLPRFERLLKATHLLEVQLQDRPLIFGETIPSSRVQAPIPDVHLVAVDVSGHSSTDRGPFLDAVLIAEELSFCYELPFSL